VYNKKETRKELWIMKGQPTKKYEEEFKKSIVSLHQSGRSQSDLSREYGISLSAICKWIKMDTEVKMDHDTILTAKQVKELQKKMLFLKRRTLY
jgi:transposase